MNFLVGAHGTGKSTILEAVRQILLSKPGTQLESPINHVIQPIFLTDGISRPIIRALDVAGLSGVVSKDQKQVLINELTVSQYLVQILNPRTLCTRSIIDIIVYSSVVFPHIDITQYQTIFLETADQIGHLFYVPIEFELQTDSERAGIWGDPNIQKQIDEAFKNFLNEHSSRIKGNVVTLSGNVEQRVQTLSKYF